MLTAVSPPTVSPPTASIPVAFACLLTWAALAHPVPALAQSPATKARSAFDLAPLNQARTAARTARALGEIETAESHSRVALSEGWRLLAEARRAQGELDLAEAAYQRAVETAPTEAARARTALATLRGEREQGERERAETTRRDADSTPERQAPLAKEDWSTNRHRFEEGVLDLQLTLDGLVDRTAAELVLENLGQVTGFGEGLEPGSLRARLVESGLFDAPLSDGSETPEEIEELTRALRLAAESEPLDRDLALVLAEIEIRHGRVPAADRQLQSLVDRFGSTTAHAQLARNALGVDRAKLALEHARRALEQAPASETVLQLTAEAAFAADRPEFAAPPVEALLRMRPDDPTYTLWADRLAAPGAALDPSPTAPGDADTASDRPVDGTANESSP